MPKPPPKDTDDISDDERECFQEAMRDPLKYLKKDFSEPAPPEPIDTDDCHSPFSGDEYLEYLDETDWVNAEGQLSFARHGLQNKVLNDFKKGRLPIQAKLDLHGYTAHEAIQMMQRFLHNCQSQHKRCALIVHGKGKFGRFHKPVLKNIVNQWLPTQETVLAFESAQPRNGGAGAIYVLIKQSR